MSDFQNRVGDRILFIVPVIHSAIDLGTLSGENGATAEGFWLSVVQGIEKSGLKALPMNVYQDGLPVCDYVERIVDDLAVAGSLNFKILQYLRDAGAVIMGTESSELLLKEYQLQKQIQAGAEFDPVTVRQHAEMMLEERDRAIAQRIDQTLDDHKVGMLFIGVTHRVELYLPQSIRVSYPFGRPGISKGNGL